MSNIQKNRNDEETLDLLYGATEIARFLRRPRQFVYNKQQHLGIRHIGATLIASKSELRKLLSQGD